MAKDLGKEKKEQSSDNVWDNSMASSVMSVRGSGGGRGGRRGRGSQDGPPGAANGPPGGQWNGDDNSWTTDDGRAWQDVRLSLFLDSY